MTKQVVKALITLMNLLKASVSHPLERNQKSDSVLLRISLMLTKKVVNMLI